MEMNIAQVLFIDKIYELWQEFTSISWKTCRKSHQSKRINRAMSGKLSCQGMNADNHEGLRRHMSNGIWILEEHDGDGTKNITLELLSEGQKLAKRVKEELAVCLIGSQVEHIVPTLDQYGAAKAYLVDDASLLHYDLDAYSDVLVELVKEHEPSIVMMGATPIGSELAPRIAARLGVPCITEVKKIAGGKDNLQITKAAYNDRLYAEVRTTGTNKPVILTLPPGETDIVTAAEKKDLEVITKAPASQKKAQGTTFKKFIKGDPRTIGVEEADLIVAVGNGVEHDVLPLVQELADAVGATMGGSRVAVDKNLIPFARQIGATGKTVAPKMVIACGISGAREFMDGMQNAKLTVAINTDAKARIFQFANLGVKGDVREVIPLVIEEIKKQKEEQGRA